MTTHGRTALRQAWFGALIGLCLAGAAQAADLPRHRGPLKPTEMRKIARQQESTVERYRRAGAEYIEATRSGAPWRSAEFEALEVHGDSILVETGKGITRDNVFDFTHAQISPAGVHVQVALDRQESGKASPTRLLIRFNPGGDIDANEGSFDRLMPVEIRKSAANTTTPSGRSTLRMYGGAQWESTAVLESDGNGRRNGKKVPYGVEHYEPGGRAGVWNRTTKTIDPVAGKLPIE
jgi:hypothetical protein